MKHTFSQGQEIRIDGHAQVSEFHASGTSCIDFQADMMDIYLVCCRKGEVSIQASFIPHHIDMGAANAIFLAYPRGKWDLNLQASENSDLYLMKLDVAVLHKLINPAFDDQQLKGDHKMNMRDLMRIIPVSPSLMMCFEQLLHHKVSSAFRHIFEKAKFLEIFSLLIENAFGNPMEACPVALSPAIETKLHQVRSHIIEHIAESPDPDKLAVMYELPRNTLREGYKYVFGKTIHQYHSDHKLESAMQMLNQGELLVKEVAFRIGYQNPSHFISAFKKKFGYTPKQYLRKEIA